MVVGAGRAGLAAAGALRRAGTDPLVVEGADAVAAAWRQRHDHLRLNTHRMFSHQPGARIPRRCGPFPARDDYVAYLEDYAAGRRLRLGTRIGRADKIEGGWRLEAGGGHITAAHTVIATGPDAVPVMPTWPGLPTFPGTVIHSGQFRNVTDAAGRDVLVVGPGNSGVDLLGHLARSDARKLWLSARSGMNITPLRLAGVPLHPVSLAARHLPVRWQDTTARAIQRVAFGDLTRLGYPRSRLGAFTRQASDGVTIAVDDGFVRALKTGRITMKPGHRTVRRPACLLHRRHPLHPGRAHLRHRLPPQPGTHRRPSGRPRPARHAPLQRRRVLPPASRPVVLRPGPEHLRQHARPPPPGPPAGPGSHQPARVKPSLN